MVAFDGIRHPGSQRGFAFPIFWLSYYIAPLFFLAGYCQRFIFHRLPFLLLQQFRRQTIVFIHLLIQALFISVYTFFSLTLLVLLSDETLPTHLLGQVSLHQPLVLFTLLFVSQTLLLCLLQLIHLCFSLKLTPLLSLLSCLILLTTTIKKTIFCNPFNFSMLSRWQDATLAQVSSWLLLYGVVLICGIHFFLRQDFYLKESKS